MRKIDLVVALSFLSFAAAPSASGEILTQTPCSYSTQGVATIYQCALMSGYGTGTITMSAEADDITPFVTARPPYVARGSATLYAIGYTSGPVRPGFFTIYDHRPIHFELMQPSLTQEANRKLTAES